MGQQIFNPADYHFAWTTDGWYTWDSKLAHEQAKYDRDVTANRAKSNGHKAKKFTLGKQRITRGGIGSGRPHIDLLVTCYGLNTD